MKQQVTTQGNVWKEGDHVSLVVAGDVVLGPYLVIPKGTPVDGRISRITRAGTFGKSGKIELTADHLDLGGRKVRLSGAIHGEGQGQLNTPATVLAAGPLGIFISGQPGEIPRGSTLTGYLAEDVPLRVARTASRNIAQSRPSENGSAVKVSFDEAFGSAAEPENPLDAAGLPVRRITIAEVFGAEMAAFAESP